MQLPTPFAGVVESLGGEVGQVLHAGEVLMRLTPIGASPTVVSAVEPDQRSCTVMSKAYWSAR